MGLTTLPPSCAVVTKSGNFNFLEPFGPLQAFNRTALPSLIHSVFSWHYFMLPAWRPTFAIVTCTIFKVELARWQLQSSSVIQKSDFLGCHAQILRHWLLIWPNESPSLSGSVSLLNLWSHDPWIWLRVNREVLTVFLGEAPWSLVEIYWRFGGNLLPAWYHFLFCTKYGGSRLYQTTRRYVTWAQ